MTKSKEARNLDISCDVLEKHEAGKGSGELQCFMGSGRFPCRGGGCRHKDSGFFLYFDKVDYLLIYECEENPKDHDLRIAGKWGDGSPIDKMYEEILDWTYEREEEFERMRERV